MTQTVQQPGPLATLSQAEAILARSIVSAAEALTDVGQGPLPGAMARLRKEADAARKRLAAARAEAHGLVKEVLADLTGFSLALLADLEADTLATVAGEGLPVAAQAPALPAPIAGRLGPATLAVLGVPAAGALSPEQVADLAERTAADPEAPTLAAAAAATSPNGQGKPKRRRGSK